MEAIPLPVTIRQHVKMRETLPHLPGLEEWEKRHTQPQPEMKCATSRLEQNFRCIMEKTLEKRTPLVFPAGVSNGRFDLGADSVGREAGEEGRVPRRHGGREPLAPAREEVPGGQALGQEAGMADDEGVS